MENYLNCLIKHSSSNIWDLQLCMLRNDNLCYGSMRFKKKKKKLLCIYYMISPPSMWEREREREPWDKFGPYFSLRPGLSIPILAQKYFRYSFSLWQVGLLPATKKTNNDNIFSYKKKTIIFFYTKKERAEG